MFRPRLSLAAIWLGILVSSTAAAEQDSQQPSLGKLFWDVSDTILQHHLDPPTRQEMLRSAIRQMYQAAGQAPPLGMGREISAISDREPMLALLREAELRLRSSPSADQGHLQMALRQGVMRTLPGGARFLTAEQLRVQRQLQDNLYVGIGIALRYDRNQGPVIQKTFPGGPAQQAGIQEKDRILEVDGTTTKGRKLEEVVDMLRDQQGTPVTVVVQQPDAPKRTVNMVRNVIPIETVVGFQRQADDSWTYRVDPSEPIAYVKIESIRGSTVGELGQVARRLRQQEDCRALILDLRTPATGPPRHTAMLADALMGAGVIGQVQDPQGIHVFNSRPDSLFQDWPMAVLVGSATTGSLEWLAAALQDNGRATIVGNATPATAYVRSLVAIRGSGEAMEMLTAKLLRGDGRSLARPEALSQSDFAMRRLLARQSGLPYANPSSPAGGPPRYAGVVPDVRSRTPLATARQLLNKMLAEPPDAEDREGQAAEPQQPG